jgi:hypothetical protein
MKEPSWDSVYLLGWVDHERRNYLTSWNGNQKVVDFVITGVTPANMPLWSAPVPQGAAVLAVPEGRKPHDFACEVGGFHAIGVEYEPGSVVRTL